MASNEEFKELIDNKKYFDAERMFYGSLMSRGISNHIKVQIAEKSAGITLEYQFIQDNNHEFKGSLNPLEENLDYHLEKTISRIEIGSKAVKKLNDNLKIYRINNNGSLNIQYKWGTNKYCNVCDWDYRSITIKLSGIAIDLLISEYKKDPEYTELINNINCNQNIPEFIQTFNDVDMHRKIGATLKDYGIDNILTENMLNSKDIINIIKLNSKNNVGKQRLKSVCIVRELGLFAAIINWYVDYSKKDINIEIQDEKLIDLENTRFVSDHSIYSRLEKRVIISEDIKASIFDD